MTRYTQPTTFYTEDHEWITVHKVTSPLSASPTMPPNATGRCRVC